MANDTAPLRSPQPDEADKTYDAIALMMVFGFFALIAATFFVRPLLSEGIEGNLFGYIASWISFIVGYRWGSSTSSRGKDSTIQKLASK